jgi:outer membrane protein
VKRRIFGMLLSALFVFSMVSVSFAADKDFKRYGVRIRGIYVLPNEHFDGAVQGVLNSLNQGQAVIDDSVAPELDLEYFFTKHISAELVLALVKNDIAVQGGHNVVGSVWLLPPSLLVKYHFMPDSCKIDPYVGFGMNVVMPFDEHLNVGPVTSLDIDTSVGWAAQIGADIPITEKCFLNIDAKYYSTETQMKLPNAFGSTKFNLDINPVIIGTGFGVRF